MKGCLKTCADAGVPTVEVPETDCLDASGQKGFSRASSRGGVVVSLSYASRGAAAGAIAAVDEVRGTTAQGCRIKRCRELTGLFQYVRLKPPPLGG